MLLLRLCVLVVLFSALLLVSASLSDIRLANPELHGRKIILHTGIHDTETESELDLEYLSDSDDEQLRQIYVHVKAPVSGKIRKLIDEAFNSVSDIHYVPHNTFVMISNKKNVRKALKENEKVKEITLWVGAIHHSHKVEEEATQCSNDDLEVEVLLMATRGPVDTDKLCAEWQQSMRKDIAKIDAKLAKSIKVTKISDKKVAVRSAKSKNCRTVIDWLSSHYRSHMIQTRETFTITSDEHFALEDDIRLLADVDPLSEEYRSILLKSAESGPIGQPSLQTVQEMWKRGFDGTGEVVAVGDTGIDYYNCFFYDNTTEVPFVNSNTKVIPQSKHRKIHSYYTYADNKDLYDGHGTHVSGSLAGNSNGQMSNFNGIAKGAKIAFMDIGTPDRTLNLPSDLTEEYFPYMHEKAGAAISSNSWGSRKYGQYTISAHEIDRYTFEHPYHLPLFASGNSGRSGSRTITSPATAKNALSVGASQGNIKNFKLGLPLYANVLLGQIKTRMCQSNSFLYDNELMCTGLGSNAPCHDKAKDTCENGYKSVSDCCKNGFMKKICCVEEMLKKVRDHPEWFNENNMATFSSRGPTKDLRIKPDLVAPGQPVFSSRSAGTTGIPHCSIPLVLQGTSQATPTMAGYALMVKQYFKRGFYPSGKETPADSMNPTSALLKAVLINSGASLTGKVEANGAGLWKDLHPIPSFTQGFGLVNVSNVMLFEDNRNNAYMFVSDDSTLQTGDSREFCFRVRDDGVTRNFKATLVWTDYPASPRAAVTLVNNLDLTVRNEETGELRHGNGGKDFVNNVEQVEIGAEGSAGKLYRVTVAGTSVPHGPQRFALVVTGQMKKVNCPAKKTAKSKIADVVLAILDPLMD
jgi:subtilisin family serine protease